MEYDKEEKREEHNGSEYIDNRNAESEIGPFIHDEHS
jgi:hypothetical protein